MNETFFLPAMAIATCLGVGKACNARGLFAGAQNGFVMRDGLLPGRAVLVGAIPQELPELPGGYDAWNSRNNRLLATLAEEISDDISACVRRYGPSRVGVVLGTSTSGIAEGEAALIHHTTHGAWPDGFRFSQQETGSGAALLAELFGLTGPAYVIATACSSGAKTFAAGRRLIASGLVDAVIVGGADTLCRLTLAGFAALGAVSAQICRPFSANRDGITIGEGGALFLLTREPAQISLQAAAETSDAYLISTPDPAGCGTLRAMEQALADAGLQPHELAYLNLHGTATPLNDVMEAKAVNALLGSTIPCSSTKAITGHTLGAAGAVEAAMLWLALSERWNPDRRLAPHIWDGVADPGLAPICLARPDMHFQEGPCAMMSNSLAFGGSNCSIVLGRS